MPNRDITVTVTMRDAASKAAEQLTRSFKEFATAAGVASQKTGTSMAQVSRGIKRSGKALAESAAGFRSLETAQRRLSSSAGAVLKRVRENRKAMAAFAAQTDQAVQAFRRNRIEMQRQAQAGRLSQRALRALDVTLKFVTRDARAAARTWAKLAVVMSVPIGRGALRGFRQIGREASAIRRTVFGLRGAILALGAGVVVGASARVAAGFESSLSKIVGLVGVSRSQVALWREELLKLGPEVSKGPLELADALFFVTSAGLRGADAMEVLRVSAMAATAGLGDAAIVADAVTSAINAFGKENLSAEKAVGILVATVREGKAAADSIAGSLGRVLSIAAEVGVSFDQVGASIAAMTRVGVSAEEAVTSLRSIMVSLLKPGKQSEEALAKLGLSFTEVRKVLREGGLLDVLTLLQSRIQGNEEALSSIFPNIRALSGALNLLRGDGKQTAQIFAALAEETGQSLGVAFAEAARTATFQWNSMRASIDEAMIAFGQFVSAVGRAGVLVAIATLAKEAGAAFKGLSKDQDGARATADAFINILESVAVTAAALTDIMDRGRQAVISFKLAWILARDAVAEAGPAFFGIKKATEEEITEVVKLTFELGRLAENFRTGATAADRVERAFEQARGAMRNLRAEQEQTGKAAKKLAKDLDLGPTFAELESFRAPFVFEFDTPGLQKIRTAKDASMDFRIALQGVLKTIRETAPDMTKLANEILKLPPGFRLNIEEAGSFTEAMLRVSEAQDVVSESTKAQKAALADTQAELEKFGTLQGAIEAGLGPLGAAIDVFNSNAVDSSKKAAIEAAQVWLRFLESSKLDAVAAAKFVTGTIQAFAGATADFVGRVLDEAFEGQIKTMQDVGRIAQDVLKNLLRSILQEMVRVTTQALITKAIIGVAAAKGGIMPGPFIPVQSFARGGIASRPTFGLIAEAGQAEAMVPLPDNRNIPVKFVGGERPGGNVANVFFNVQTLDPRGVAEVLLSSAGRQSIRSAVADGMRRQPRFKKILGGRS